MRGSESTQYALCADEERRATSRARVAPGAPGLHRGANGADQPAARGINRVRRGATNRVQWVRRDALVAAEALPTLAQAAVADLRTHLTVLDERIGAYDRELQVQARQSEAAQRLMQIRGVLTAVAIVATVGNARDFSSGRQFAAWLGLTPRQHSTGGKPRLGHITRRGDAYLRMLLVQGARSVLQTALRHTDRLSR
jgi:transposase